MVHATSERVALARVPRLVYGHPNSPPTSRRRLMLVSDTRAGGHLPCASSLAFCVSTAESVLRADLVGGDSGGNRTVYLKARAHETTARTASMTCQRWLGPGWQRMEKRVAGSQPRHGLAHSGLRPGGRTHLIVAGPAQTSTDQQTDARLSAVLRVPDRLVATVGIKPCCTFRTGLNALLVEAAGTARLG